MTDASKPPEEHIERCAVHAGCPKYKDDDGYYCIWCRVATLTRQRDGLVEALEITAIKAYNIGTLRGHTDTVDGCFVCVLPQDLATYNEDVVKEMLTDGSLPEAKAALEAAKETT